MPDRFPVKEQEVTKQTPLQMPRLWDLETGCGLDYKEAAVVEAVQREL